MMTISKGAKLTLDVIDRPADLIASTPMLPAVDTFDTVWVKPPGVIETEALGPCLGLIF